MDNHLGSINEFKAGALGADKIPPKPNEMVVYELLQKTGLPLVAGGLLDQPHIWILQYEIIKGIIDRFKAADEMNERMEEEKRTQKMIANLRNQR